MILKMLSRSLDEAKEHNPRVEDKVKLALCSILAFLASGTMKVKGTIKGREVVVMVDWEATHNFMYRM